MSFERHLDSPRGRGALAGSPYSGAAGGAPCGDLVRVSLDVDGDRIAAAGFDAEGCGAAVAAGSAVVELVEARPVLEVARIGPEQIAAELGGLIAPKRHAAELAADALHRALGAAARAGALRSATSPRRTLVAMSGGVDSAAAAQLALDAGEEVVGVTLELWSDPATNGERSCCSPQAVIGARALAHGMGIPHLTLDLRDRFRAEVVDDFLGGYAAGRTPSPCVRCNGLVRFDALLALADRLGAGKLVTGHYARITRDGEGPLLRAAADPRKDQSYVLARLRPGQLERLSFPLGGLTKPAVRKLAADAGLPVADRRESQDLCFLAGQGRRDFLRRHGGRRLAARPGVIVDREGRNLGRHDGQHEFTIGQRRGIGVAATEPLYVVDKDARTNTVVVGPRDALTAHEIHLEQPVLYRAANRVDAVRLRYHAPAKPCSASAGGDRLALGEPGEAPAPGQLACLLSGDVVVGYGTIGSAS